MQTHGIIHDLFIYTIQAPGLIDDLFICTIRTHGLIHDLFICIMQSPGNKSGMKPGGCMVQMTKS
jgi:hypothetical protein